MLSTIDWIWSREIRRWRGVIVWESPSIKMSCSYSSGVVALLCLFDPLGLASGSLGLSLTKNLSNVVWFCLHFNTFLKWNTTLSLSITWFTTSLAGWYFSPFPKHFLSEVGIPSFPSFSERAFQLPSAAVPSEGLGVPWWSPQCGGPLSTLSHHHHPPPSPWTCPETKYPLQQVQAHPQSLQILSAQTGHNFFQADYMS